MKMIEICMQHPSLLSANILSVNIPLDATLRSPISITSISKESYGKAFKKEDGHFLLREPPIDFDVAEEGTDISALHQKYISVTPLHLELTSASLVKSLRKMLPDHW